LKENDIITNSRKGRPGKYAVLLKGIKKNEFEPFVGQLVDVEHENKW